jgi:hypothetical protein
MKYVKVLIVIASAIASFWFGCNGNSWGDLMKSRVRQVLGSDFDDYQFFSYPTDNYGLATCYRANDLTKDFICDEWNCLGIPDSFVQQHPEMRLTLNGFAAMGVGGAITLSESEASSLAMDFVLPQVNTVLDVEGGFDAKRVTKTALRINQATVRRLRMNTMLDYLRGLDSTNEIKRAYLDNNLAIVVADIVIDKMVVDISVDSEMSSKLSAKLDPGISTKVFSGGRLGFTISSSTSGRYTIDITNPVVVAYLVKRGDTSHRQPPGNLAFVAPEDSDWNEWIRIRVPEPRLR